jgi:hypothetical protein
VASTDPQLNGRGLSIFADQPSLSPLASVVDSQGTAQGGEHTSAAYQQGIDIHAAELEVLPELRTDLCAVAREVTRRAPAANPVGIGAATRDSGDVAGCSQPGVGSRRDGTERLS